MGRKRKNGTTLVRDTPSSTTVTGVTLSANGQHRIETSTIVSPPSLPPARETAQTLTSLDPAISENVQLDLDDNPQIPKKARFQAAVSTCVMSQILASQHWIPRITLYANGYHSATSFWTSCYGSKAVGNC